MTPKVAISLPPELLRLVESEREQRGVTRSEFIRTALLEHFERIREREEIASYQASYRAKPEELAGWSEIAALAWSDNEWDEGP
jgi:metal-responsive CopG/Arc/MetJ family transcriptional regulator